MRLVLNMVVHNEANRYLDSCLAWIADSVDEIFVYDDRSDDESVDIAMAYGAHVVIRPKNEPSFLEAEGRFRQRGWEWMVDCCRLGDGDWVLALDADEFPVSFLPKTTTVARLGFRFPKSGAVKYRIAEIFSMYPLAERIDGHWGRIEAVRLARFRSGKQTFRSKLMGCGMFPAYVYENPARLDEEIQFLHFGYAAEEDRKAKADRYSGIAKQLHSRSHIDSILKTPTLSRWVGAVPEVRRGWR